MLVQSSELEILWLIYCQASASDIQSDFNLFLEKRNAAEEEKGGRCEHWAQNPRIKFSNKTQSQML